MSHRLSILGPRGDSLSVVAAGDHGPPLILLHGFPLDHRLWQNQMDYFSQRFRVIAPELRGFGQSTLDEPPYRIQDLADDIERIRCHLASNQSIVLCGLSMGGYVAFEYWRLYGAQLKGLVLTNTKPDADDDLARQARLAMAERAIQAGAWSAVEGMLPKLLSEHALQHLPEVVAWTQAMMKAVPAQTVAAAQYAMANRRDFRTLLSEIHVPTLVVTGDRDPIAPPQATQQWSEQIAHSQFVAIPDCGHLCPLEAPQEFNRVLRGFLTQLE